MLFAIFVQMNTIKSNAVTLRYNATAIPIRR